MESKNEFPNQQTPYPLKDLMMEEFSAVDPKVNLEEKSTIFTHHSFFHNILSRYSFKPSTFKDIKIQIQERAKNVKASRVITLIVILIIIGIFSIPVILYYAPNRPMLESSRFIEGNISMVNLLWNSCMYVVKHCRDGMVQNSKIWIHCLKIHNNNYNNYSYNHIK